MTREALKLISDIASGSTTANSLQNIAKIANEALAQPEQEFVAMKFKIYLPVKHQINHAKLPWVYDQDRSTGNVASMWVTPVATLPPQRKPDNEPVQWGVEWGKAGETPCVSIIKRLPNGGIEVVAVEYGPRRELPKEQWIEVTETLLNAQHHWLYEPMWIAMPNGHVTTGYYEWRQGRSPDRFITDDLGDIHAFSAAFVMPLAKPKAPICSPANDIKETTC